MSFHGNYTNSTPSTFHNDIGHALHVNGLRDGPSRSRTPNIVLPPSTSSQLGNALDHELGMEDEPKVSHFRSLYAQTEARIDALFSEPSCDATEKLEASSTKRKRDAAEDWLDQPVEPPKKRTRVIDEDDYDDSDEEEEVASVNVSPLKAKSTGTATIPRLSSPTKLPGIPPSPALTSVNGSSTQWQGRTSDDVRKRIEEDKKAAEENAKRSFQTMFYTLDNDRDAMLEQQRLEESDRQVDAEMTGHGNATTTVASTEGTLSQANLGASSLVLKHLIARIDAKREKVKASDQELRNLMIEVKKNRSKWASEEKIGQEELYEAAEKVLSEVKAMTEHSQPFLQRVNKRDAPDYNNVIKRPMDLSTMTKKLKSLQYKSKQEFVEDLNLIWSNCLKYNANPEHFLRRHALFMRKETEKLVPLIPDIVIRDRAEVEAEERRQRNVDGDPGEDSDDEPIISSRGRKAPGKKAKKGATSRKEPPSGRGSEGTPGAETKPNIQGLHSTGSSTNLKHEFLRTDSDMAMEGSQNGLSTPPPGTTTPAGLNGHLGSGQPGSQVDPLEMDAFGNIASGSSLGHPLGAPLDHDDLEYKTWKQVTKKDRALMAAERHRLFKGDHLNPDEPALLRTKAGMRRWLRKQKEGVSDAAFGKRKSDAGEPGEAGPSGESLAEGMEGTEERMLPDYYDTMAAIPELPERLQWIEDEKGNVIPTSEEYLRVVPKGLFTSPQSEFTKKMESNMRQMQDTRKVCTKIGIVKQMQLQSQMYQNQFQKYDPERFVEQDIETHVVSDDGPVMSQPVCRATMQRSVAKIFYHAGFEEFQPSALEAITDIANDYFFKLARSLATYMQIPKVPVTTSVSGSAESKVEWKRKFSTEETILHCLLENGIDVDALETYVKDDVDRLTGKLGVMHDRMKAHLADLLRPALTDAGPDGVNAFNDGSEQFIGGDFAEDLDEDFFGFKELGLDKEFGLASLSVPLHLLQNRMHNHYTAQNPSAATNLPSSLPPPPPHPPVTVESIEQEIAIVQAFFKAKLAANNNNPLVEDEDLPQKQRFPKPRLPPTGKISSPRKKPMREAGPGKGHPKKKMKLVDGNWVRDDSADKDPKAKGKKGKSGLAIEMERVDSRDGEGDADGDADGDIDDAPIPMVLDKKDKMQEKKVNRVNGETNGHEGGLISPESQPS